MESPFTEPVTTNRLYSVHLKDHLDLIEFAVTHKNCKVHFSNQWRCTYNSNNFTLNIYKKGKYILFTKVLDENGIREHMFKLFHQYPTQIVLRNWSIKVYFHSTIDLDGLKASIKNSDLNKTMEELLKNKLMKQTNKESNKETVQLNKQAFTAVILRPFKPYSKIAFSIFASGKIGITGLKSKSDLTLVQRYLNETLLIRLEENMSNISPNDMVDEDDDLFAF